MAGAAGFDDGPQLAIGSVLGIRQWARNADGELTGVHGMPWKDGENTATCTTNHPVPWSVNAKETAAKEKERDRLRAEWMTFQTMHPSGVDRLESHVQARYWRTYRQWEKLDAELRDKAQSDCGCGFWGYWEFTPNEFSFGDRPVVGVIEGYSRTILGSRGFRCHKARIVALHCAWEYILPKEPVQREAGASWSSVFSADYESGTAEGIARLAQDEEELAAKYPSATVCSSLKAMLARFPPTPRDKR